MVSIWSKVTLLAEPGLEPRVLWLLNHLLPLIVTQSLWRVYKKEGNAYGKMLSAKRKANCIIAISATILLKKGN